MDENLALKRHFIMRAFTPLGTEVCDAMGLPPASADVADMQEKEAMVENHLVLSMTFDQLSDRVQWYIEARQASQDNYLILGRTLADDLLAFSMSLFNPVVIGLEEDNDVV